MLLLNGSERMEPNKLYAKLQRVFFNLNQIKYLVNDTNTHLSRELNLEIEYSILNILRFPYLFLKLILLK